MKRGKDKRGQVWIETVIYTLIAFVMIGLVLSFARPKIQELQDQLILDQSIEVLKKIDSTILSMGSAGNQRILPVTIKKGEIQIDGEEDKIIFNMESKSLYSEPDKEIIDGSVIILTKEKTDLNLVTLTLDYNEIYNLTMEGKDEKKSLSSASTEYSISIIHKGFDSLGKPTLDFTI
jgi:hypothetical protein